MMSYNKVRAIFGRPGTNIITSKKVAILGDVRCHRKVEKQLRGAMKEIALRGYRKYIDLDDYQANGGCYVYRKMRGSNKWSRHAWGIAIDINPSDFPFPYHGQASAKRERQQRKLIKVFKHWGFTTFEHDLMHQEISVIYSRPTLQRFWRFLRILKKRQA